MSASHVEQFIKRAMTDMGMLQRLSAGAGSLETYVDLCVKEAKSLGYDFTAAEATNYVKQFVETSNKGELSDIQLELVAGGKANFNAPGHTAPSLGGSSSGPAYQHGGKVSLPKPGGGGTVSPPPSFPPVGLPPGQFGGKRR